MKLFYNLLFKRGGKNVSVYIYLLLFIGCRSIALLLQNFKTFENKWNNREHAQRLYYYEKGRQLFFRRATFKNVETKNVIA